MPTNPTWEDTVETPAWQDTTESAPGSGATRDFRTPAQAEKLQRQVLPTAITPEQFQGMSDRAARDEQMRRGVSQGMEAGTGLTTAIYQDLPAAIGTAMHDAGTAIYEGGVNAIANTLPEFANDPNEIAQQYDTETAIRSLPTGQRIFARAGEGLVKSTPQMAVALVNPYAGALAFGFTPEGFSPKHAAIAAALPFIGTKVGAVVENIAARAGVSTESALMAWNKLGGAAGATGFIAADEAHRISQLPEAEQGQAWIDAAGNIGSQFLLGGLGHAERLKSTERIVETTRRKQAEAARPAATRASEPMDEGAAVPEWEATTARQQTLSPAAQEMPAPTLTAPARAVETKQAASADAAGDVRAEAAAFAAQHSRAEYEQSPYTNIYDWEMARIEATDRGYPLKATFEVSDKYSNALDEVAAMREQVAAEQFDIRALATESPRKPSLASNVQTGTEMPVQPQPASVGGRAAGAAIKKLHDEVATTGSRYVWATIDGQPWKIRIADHSSRGGNSRESAAIHGETNRVRREQLMKGDVEGREFPFDGEIITRDPSALNDADIVELVRKNTSPDFYSEESNILDIQPESVRDYLSSKKSAPESEASRTINDSLKSASNQIQTESQMVKRGTTPPQSSNPVNKQSSSPQGTGTSPGQINPPVVETAPVPPSVPQSAIGNRQSVETPAAAVAKVQEHVTDVASGAKPTAPKAQDSGLKTLPATGTRPAKEIKTELVQRLEEKIDRVIADDSNSAAPVQKSADGSRWAFNNEHADVTFADGKWEVKTYLSKLKAKFATEAEAERFVKAAGSNGSGKVTVEIPGDGKFTIWNDGPKLLEVWLRAKSLDTSAGKEAATTRVSRTPTVERVIETYGSADKAYAMTRRQIASLEDAADVKSAESFANDIYKKTEAYRLEDAADSARTYQHTIERDIAANEKAITRIEKLKRQTSQHKQDLAELQAELKQNKKRLDEADAKAAKLENDAARENAKLEAQTTPAGATGINTGNLGEAGMGGAKPTEFRHNPQSPTGIRNAVVDQERVKRGLPPAMEAARKDFGTTWDEAMARMDQDPEAAIRLVDQLQRQPRALSDVENALLLHRQIELQNEYGKLTRDLAQAFEDGQSFPNRLETMEELKARVAETSDKLQVLYDTGKAVGTEQGRGLASRKMLAFEDYSLAKMEMEKRAAKGGTPLSDVERAELGKLQERIAKTEQEFQAYREKQEAERANRMTDEAIREIQDELKRRPNYDPRIIQVAEEIVVKLEKQAVSAQERLKAKFARTNTGLDPTIIYDLGVVGAAKIARLGLDFGKFSAAMLADFGDGIQPYLQAAWERSNLHLENEGAKYGDKAPQVKNLLRKRDASGKRENVIEGLKKGVAEGVPMELQGDYIRKLAESFVEGGITKREPLIDAVHEVLTKQLGLDMTRRETMDAISGYGKFKPLNTNAIKATLRDLRGQMQQVSKLEDIQARQPLQKTGVERRSPSDEERRLVQQVNEAKRRFGVVVNDPARQLKSALDAIKTRLKHQIADIEYQLTTKERIVKTKSPSPVDAETQLLELRRDGLRAQLDELLPKPGLTPEQQIARVMASLERSVADYERRIKGGDVAARERKTPLSSPALEALRARRDAVKAEWQELRDTLDPEHRERAALSAVKSRLAQSTANYMDRLARRDFKKREHFEPRLDAEALRLKAANEIAKREFHRGLIMDRLANQSTGQKIYGGVKEMLNLPRNLLSSWDVSAVLRQGGFIGLGNPARAAAALGPMFRALASEKAAVMVEQEILSRPNAPLYKQAKLYLAPHEALHLSAMEEQIMSRLAGKVPGLRASNRAYITFLNRLRADSFDALLESVARKDGSLNQPEMQAIANYVNVATGRGDLGTAAAAAETLATVFFSPRLVASRFQLLALQPMYSGSARTRKAIALEYGKFLAGIGVVYALGSLAGASIEHDPRGSDFGKLRFGDTRVDVLGGLGQASVLLSRLGTGQTRTMDGELRSIRGDVPYGARTSQDVIADFLRSKLSPVAGAAVDMVQQKNVVGEPVTIKDVAINLTVPLSFRDIYDVMQDQGMTRGSILTILSLFGFGLQHYAARQRNSTVDEMMKHVRGLTPEQRATVRAKLEATK